MSCAEIIPKLELMADDELSSEQAAEVLSHIDDCASCRDNWYGILNLRKAIKERAFSFSPSAAFEEKMINAVRKEAWQSKQAAPQKLLYVAAGLIVAGMAALIAYRAAVVGTQTTVPKRESTTVVSPKSDQKLQLASLAPTSLDDAVANFKQFLKLSGSKRLGGHGVNDSDLSVLSQRAGFSIRPMQFSGFRLADAQLVNTSPGKASVVRLCYLRRNGTGHDAILCYQASAGRIVAKGLNEHMIDGKRICCGEVEDKSIVYIPGQKTNANEVLLLGTISKSDLMDMVLSNS